MEVRVPRRPTMDNMQTSGDMKVVRVTFADDTTGNASTGVCWDTVLVHQQIARLSQTVTLSSLMEWVNLQLAIGLTWTRMDGYGIGVLVVRSRKQMIQSYFGFHLPIATSFGGLGISPSRTWAGIAQRLESDFSHFLHGENWQRCDNESRSQTDSK